MPAPSPGQATTFTTRWTPERTPPKRDESTMTELSEDNDRVLTAADARLALGEQLHAMLES